MKILIAGGGIGGLTAALSLQAAGFGDVTVYESAAEITPLGVGVNLPPHAVRELTELGLGDDLARLGVLTSAFDYYDPAGRLIWSEPRGEVAGYHWPQYSIHRGSLQMLLLRTVQARLGPDSVRTGCAVTDVTWDAADRPTLTILDRSTGSSESHGPDVVVGADGIRSTVRGSVLGNENHNENHLAWNGWVIWRGVTHMPAYLNGTTMVVIGDEQQRVVAYPIGAAPDTNGQFAVNWLLSRPAPHTEIQDHGNWNRPVEARELTKYVDGMTFDWFDVPALIGGAEMVYEYAMVDLEPLKTWSRGAVTLLGDAAHAMYPFGSNGASQAILDARILVYHLVKNADSVDALSAYEADRRPATTQVQLANRRQAGTVMSRVSALARDQARGAAAKELEVAEGAYKKIAGFDAEQLNSRPSWDVHLSPKN